MTSALIPPVIPRRSAPGNWPRGRPGAAGPLPASPRQAPALAADVVYCLGRVDASGRVADRTVRTGLLHRARKASVRNGPIAETAAALATDRTIQSV
jgi:hypothetical protein